MPAAVCQLLLPLLLLGAGGARALRTGRRRPGPDESNGPPLSPDEPGLLDEPDLPGEDRDYYDSLCINGYAECDSAPIPLVADKLRGAETGRAWIGRPEARPQETGRYKIILFMGHYGGAPSGALQCPSPCALTTDARDMGKADAIVWNGAYSPWAIPFRVLNGTTRPKVIFNFFFEPQAQWKRRAEIDRGERFFDWTATFRPDSDFPSPMWRLVRTSDDRGAGARDASEGREHLVLAMVSNCESERIPFLQALNSSLPEGALHIYGRCGEPVPCPGRDESTDCYQDFFRKFRFYAAFENFRCRGYITEKAARGFQHGMVPIMAGGFGRQDYDSLGIPRESYLHIDDFKSIQELAHNISDMDNATYNSIVESSAGYEIQRGQTPMFCDVCSELHKDPNSQKPAWSSRKSMADWFYQGSCMRHYASDRYLAR